MHSEILTDGQNKMLPLVRVFSQKFGLVGGTAIALHLGHRRSIDFDLFSKEKFENENIRNQIRKNFRIEQNFVDNPNELTVLVNDIKMTFYKYPFDIKYSVSFKDIIKLPSLLNLASMKAFALGQRAKWKDYVDLYFIFKEYSLKEVSENTKKIFKGEFNEKLFREQLAYHKDVDYSETVDFMKGFEVSDGKIKENLIEISLQE